MTVNDLWEEINIEIELIEGILQETASLQEDIADHEPTTREKTAAAAFPAQFYGGIENILKRISKFYSILLPTGDTWHMDLFKQFCITYCKCASFLPLKDDQIEHQLIAIYDSLEK